MLTRVPTPPSPPFRAHRLDQLQESLMEIEVGLVECLKDLCAEFDRNYTELADAAKNQFSGFFSQAREMEQAFFEAVSRQAIDLLEKANMDPPLLDLESLGDDARRLITDKDSGAMEANGFFILVVGCIVPSFSSFGVRLLRVKPISWNFIFFLVFLFVTPRALIDFQNRYDSAEQESKISNEINQTKPNQPLRTALQ